jgi:serine/threonine protein kinase
MSLVGRQVGRYRILEQLGSGGMSVVYKGLDTALDREVAVKVLHPHLSSKDESRKRLAREAKAVAKLHHPNILEVFDFSSADTEEAYIVTEYIRGQTLRQFVSQEPFHPPETAALVIHGLAAALSHAHDTGIIHRDLKPENVMVREDGVLKLMDFGIAKIIDRDDKMTITGSLMGSPAHMAPEIIEGEAASPEADIFSLGTMLYLFTTSHLPFNAPNTTALLKKILDGAYGDPRQLAPAISDELAEIIATCLARQPSLRYPNAGKLRDALADYLGAMGLSRPDEELSAFFADPKGYQRKLVPRLVERLLARAQAMVGERRPAKALAAVNQILALEHDNASALQLLGQMNRARKRQKAAATGRKAALAAAGLAVLAAGGVALYRADTPPMEPIAEPTPPSSSPTPMPEQAPPSRPEPEAAERPRQPPAAVASRQPPATAKLAPAAPRVPVQIRLVPWGSLELDDGTKLKEEKALHMVKLAPGKHELTAGCSVCETTRAEIDVRPEGEHIFHVKVTLKPANLRFHVEPAEAMVRIDGRERMAKDTLRHPFTVSWLATPEGVRHRVHYEISMAGYQTHSGELDLEPGKEVPVEGKLTPQ